MSLTLIDLPGLDFLATEQIQHEASRISREQKVTPSDYVLGAHLGEENVAAFVALVNALDCRAVVVEPSYRARVALEKNLWLNTSDRASVVYCTETRSEQEDVDRANYRWINAVLPGVIHNEHRRASYKKGVLREDDNGMRCHTLDSVVGDRKVCAAVLGDIAAELAVRSKAHRLGEIVPTLAAVQRASKRKDFEQSAFYSATWGI